MVLVAALADSSNYAALDTFQYIEKSYWTGVGGAETPGESEEKLMSNLGGDERGNDRTLTP